MGNSHSSGRTCANAASVLTSCCKCRTYSIDVADGGAGHNGAAAPANTVEMGERQPVAPGSEEPVDNQPPAENTHENPPDTTGMFGALRPRLPRPPKNPVGKLMSQQLPLFSWLLLLFLVFLRFTRRCYPREQLAHALDILSSSLSTDAKRLWMRFVTLKMAALPFKSNAVPVNLLSPNFESIF